jgi:hypothetical protein
LADPAKPEIAGRLVLAKTPLRLNIAQGHAWIACDQGGLQVVSLAQPRNPQLVGAWAPESGGVTRVAVRDKLALVAVPGRGVSLLDIADPAKPTEQKSIAYTQPIADVALQDKQAYVLADKVYLLDIAKPEAATQVGEYAIKQSLVAAAPLAAQTLVLTSNSLQLANFRAAARPRPIAELTWAAVAKALEPARAVQESPEADTPEAATPTAAPGAGEHQPTAMLVAEEVSLSTSPELATAPAGDHAAAGIEASAAGDAEPEPVTAAESAAAAVPQAKVESRLRVVDGTILVIADGQVAVLEVQEQKAITPRWRVPDVAQPSAADLLGTRLVIAQADGQLSILDLTAEGLQAVGSLQLSDQISTESLPSGPEPLPVSEGARDAMKNTPQPSSQRPTGAPGPA